MTTHTLMGGRLHLYKRDNSGYWQCSTYLAGKNRRISTREEGFDQAKEFAEDWYIELRGKQKVGGLKDGKTFREAAVQFMREYKALTAGQRNAQYVDGHERRLKLHLLPFFGDRVITEITAGLVQEYRIHRIEQSPPGKQPANSTIHQEIVVLRQTLKAAHRHQWIQFIPDLSPPFKAHTKITHRAWFSPDEYRQLYEATRKRAAKPIRKRWKWASEQLHDYVLLMANTGLRPDESARLEYRDVTIVEDESSGETILEIEVRGKRGVGYCKSTSGAVRPFKRLLRRNQPKPTDRLFPSTHRELFNTILDELDLKIDRDGNRRTAYSLRHTYICLRLMEGADIYQIAKNCRTSVEMIEKYYASHIRTSINAAAVNVRRARPKPVLKTKSVPKSARKRRHAPKKKQLGGNTD